MTLPPMLLSLFSPTLAKGQYRGHRYNTIIIISIIATAMAVLPTLGMIGLNKYTKILFL